MQSLPRLCGRGNFGSTLGGTKGGKGREPEIILKTDDATSSSKLARGDMAASDLLDAALATQPIEPITTAPVRRRRFTVIEGGQN
jgi:hypothetical protein